MPFLRIFFKQPVWWNRTFFFQWIICFPKNDRATRTRNPSFHGVFLAILQVENHQIQQVGRTCYWGNWSLIIDPWIQWGLKWIWKTHLPLTTLTTWYVGHSKSFCKIHRSNFSGAPEIPKKHLTTWPIYNYLPLDRKSFRASIQWIKIKMHQVIYSHFDKMNPLTVSISTESFRPDVSNKQSPASLSTSPSVNTKTTLPKGNAQVFQRCCLVKMFFFDTQRK